MAATRNPSKFSHSKFLFTHDDGNPMTFYMRPCAERGRLKPEIEYGGGEVTAKVVKNAIKLASDGDFVSSDDYISTQFIDECIKANKLIEIDNFRLPVRKSFRTLIQNAEETVVSDISDDESSTYQTNTKARDYKGRMQFKTREDLAMLRYIIDNGRQRELSGKALYRDMEMLEITNHSAESMSCRIRKNVMPNIDKYDIPDEWKHKLTGDPKYLDPKSTSHEVNGISKYFQKSPVKNVSIVLSRSPDRMKISEWKSKESENLHLKTYSKKDKNKKSWTELDNLDSDETSDDDSLDLELINTAVNGKRTKSHFGHSSSEATSSSPVKRDLRSSKVSSVVIRNTRTTKGDNSPTKGDKPPTKGDKSPTKGDKSPTKGDKSPTKGDQSPTKGNKFKTDGQVSPKNTSPMKRKLRSMQVGDVSEQGDITSPASKLDVSIEIDENNEKGDSEIPPRKQRKLNQSKPSTKNHKEMENEEAGSSSSSPEKKLPTRQKKSSWQERQKVRLRMSKLLDKYMTRNSNVENSQATESETDGAENNTEDENDEAVQEITNFTKKISRLYNLTIQEAYHCLWINNGSFKDTVSWIETGYNSKGLPPWDPGDDDALDTEVNINRLINKYHGVDSVHERQVFLEL